MSSIKLSPEHGVNPTIPICFFCRNEKNEIALLGHIKKRDKNGRAIKNSDIEAPRNMILDYEPCEKCRQAMSAGITIIEASEDNKNNIPMIAPGVVPTGSWCIIKEEAFDRIFGENLDEKMYNDVKSKKTMLLCEDIYRQLSAQTE